MSDLVARTGRHQQCYDAGCRLVVGEVSGSWEITNSGAKLTKTSSAQKVYAELQCLLLVTEGLESWLEQSTRSRLWLTIPEAAENRRYAWMSAMRFYVASPSGITKVLPVDFPDPNRFGYHIEAKCYGL